MGIELDFVAGEGPQIANPVRSTRDVQALRTPPAGDSLHFTLEAIRLATAALTPRGVPLIGFAGAPFTLASYVIEGGASKNYELTKGFMYGEPDAWALLMDRLTAVTTDYLAQQVGAGADPRCRSSIPGPERSVLWTTRVIGRSIHASSDRRRPEPGGVPVIYFSTGTSGLLCEGMDP